MSEPAPRAEWHLPTLRIGRRVLVFKHLDSTNRVATELTADPGNDGIAVLAEEQTAGRGQYQRTWHSSRGGVWLSVLVFPPPELRRPAVITAWAAVGVTETVQDVTGRPARLKWPNDVYFVGRKVCGILCEQGRGTVVGIGLNVRQTAAEFAAAGLPDAGSLAMFTPEPPEVEAVARMLLTRLDDDWDALLAGDLGTLEAGWKWHLGLLGRQVCAELADGSAVRGRLRECAFAGLELMRPDGSLRRLSPEAVRQLRADDTAVS